jgi:glycosyltransferase involved in cell wall biosynthesis
MTPPLFTVVVPTCNRLALLKKTIDALGKQTLSQYLFTIIVVNDGSCAETSKWLTQQKITHIDIEACGPATARNRGASLASNEFIAFTDDDALPAVDWLSEAYKFIKENSNTNAFEGRVIAQGIKKPLTHFVEHDGAGGFLTCNLFVRRLLFHKLNGFNIVFRYPMNEDYEFAVRLQKEINIDYVNTLIVYHPVISLSFMQQFENASSFVTKRVVSDKILFELQPDNYGDVKADSTFLGTLRRQALFYTFDEIRRTSNLLYNPLHTIGWIVVLLKRQLFFLFAYLGRYSI